MKTIKRNISPQKCSGCGQLLSRDWPYALCDPCWREKYHAPPGENYFPEDGPAVKLAESHSSVAPHSYRPTLLHVSSSALDTEGLVITHGTRGYTTTSISGIPGPKWNS